MEKGQNITKVCGIDVCLIEPDIVRYEVPPDMRITLAVLEELASYANTLVPTGKRKVLSVFNSIFLPSREASDFMVDPRRTDHVAAEAFCINSAGLKVMANFYFKIKRPVIKSRVFVDETLALDWLKKQ